MTDGLGPSRSAQLILVVEDEPDVRLSAVEALSAMGYRTAEAGNATEALARLERQPEIALVLTDVRMAGEMDGAELAFTVRSRWPAIGIIVISGYFDPKKSRLPAGVGFLSKPYRITDLRAAIDRQLENRRNDGARASP